MKHTTRILATAALLALSLSAPARAEDGMMDGVKTGFSQAIKDIQTWFGDDTPDTIEPAAGEPGFEVTSDDALQVPTPVDPSLVEPAAGTFDDDMLQVPPPYLGPDNTTGTPRASAFDGNQSNVAFGGDSGLPAMENYDDIAPAAGEGAATATIDCAAIRAGAASDPESVDMELIAQCDQQDAALPVAADAATITPIEESPKSPAQPAFEIEAMPAEPAAPAAPATTPIIPEALPETQPATGQ